MFEAHVCPQIITNPPVKRVLSCPARTTFYQLHQALQLAFGWASTHDWDFAVKYPAYTEPEDGEAAMEQIMKRVLRNESRNYVTDGVDDAFDEEEANEPREFLFRIKPPKNPAMLYPPPDSMMGNMRRSHPRTPEGNAAKVRLFEVFDKEEFKGLEYAYTYDFGDGWEHVIKVVGRAPATDRLTCTGGEGKGIAEDVGGCNGWEELKAAYHTENPNEKQKEKMNWYEMGASNADMDGLGGNRAARWSKAEVNRRLAEAGL